MTDTKELGMIREAIKLRRQLKAQCDDIDAEAKRQKLPLQDKITLLDRKIGETVNSGSGITQVKTENDGMVYLSRLDSYTAAERAAVDQWVLNALPKSVSQRARDALRQRLGIFSNTLIKEVCEEYRLETGGELQNKRVVGGDLPDGVRFTTKEKLNYRKTGDGENSND